jgi:predicted transcriptional regulator
MQKPPLGDQELEVLRFVTDNGPITVRDVVEQYGEPRDIARTTIMTVMERLRGKRYLDRVKKNGVYEYSAPVAKAELLQTLVKEFVEKTLGGSVSPFSAYLAQATNLSQDELEELKKTVADMESEGNV